MPYYLISFEKGAMDHFTEADWPVVSKDSHAVIQEAKDAGVFVFGGGLDYENNDVEHAVVATDGMVTDGPYPEAKELIGGFWIVDAPDLDVALKLAAEGSRSCNRRVEVRPFLGS